MMAKRFEDDGDGGDKVNFGSHAHRFTLHPFEDSWPHIKLQSLEEEKLGEASRINSENFY